MSKIIDYYFMPASPFSYLGHQRFAAIAQKHGAAINVKPVDMPGQIFPVSGGLPLAKRAPQRQAYRLVELERWSKFLSMPLNPRPKFHPVAIEPGALLIIAALPLGERIAMNLGGALLRAVWAEERDIANPETLKTIAREEGLDADTLMETASKPAAKAIYDANTAEAIERKIFGAPSFLYKGELLWGQDRLEFLDRALAA